MPGFDLGLAVLLVGPARGFRITGVAGIRTIQAAAMTFHQRPHPDFLAGLRIAGVETADDAELVTRGAVDQQHLAGLLILDDGRRAGHRVAGGVVLELLEPDDLAGLGIQRDQAGIERAHVDLVAEDRGATVDHVAARTDVFRQAVRVGPKAFASLGVEREHPRIRTGDVDDAVMHQRLAFLAALLFVTERERPLRSQRGNVRSIDLAGRAVALGLHAEAVHQHVLGARMVVLDVVPGDQFVGARGACSGQRDQAGGRRDAERASQAAGRDSDCHLTPPRIFLVAPTAVAIGHNNCRKRCLSLT